MQFFAWDENEAIGAHKAIKKKDYRCPECSGAVRVRSGPHRQPHFYHHQANPLCRQHEKSKEHLHAQLMLLDLLPQGECSMERPFPSIGRIADIAWETQQIVFEIQCSPISWEEAAERIRDYHSLGLEVVWILHEKSFNRRTVSAAELFLRRSACYFTNINALGQGVIYDQFDICHGATRRFTGPPLPVHLDQPKHITEPESARFPPVIRERKDRWRLYFSGDFLDSWQRDLQKKETANHLEQLLERVLKKKKQNLLNLKTIKRGYCLLLASLLKKLSSKK